MLHEKTWKHHQQPYGFYNMWCKEGNEEVRLTELNYHQNWYISSTVEVVNSENLKSPNSENEISLAQDLLPQIEEECTKELKNFKSH